MEPTSTEPWYQRSTLYQIYPLSFADSDGDGFGDIQGIIDHLDYLNDGTDESLGIGAIWLSPVYLSPMADWGYDVADHKAIDPRFGTMGDFERLVGEVHKRGMKLLMDFVPNHTSVEHEWFKKSRSNRYNEKRDWYIWADPKPDGGPPNNWLSHFGGSAWELDKITGQYYLHSFFVEQPDLNWRNHKVRQEMLDVLRFWLSKGVDGFRGDAVTAIIKDDQLRDDVLNPEFEPGVTDPSKLYLRVHSEQGKKDLNEIVGSFCDVLAEVPGSYLVSESYLDIPGLQQMYDACRKHPVHAPFNFNLMKLEWGAKIFRSFIDEYESSMGPEDWPNYVLGNHDNPRLASRVGPKRARLLAMLQLSLRGLPIVYNGDELGLPDAVVEDEQRRDPVDIRLPGYKLGRDPGRAPMAWNSSEHAGFTRGEPWLPLAEGARHMGVANQERDPESMLSLYRHLIHLRNTCPALSVGDYRSMRVDNPNVYGYIRETELQRFFVLLNFSEKAEEVTLSGRMGAWVAGTHEVLGSGEPPEGETVKLKPFEGRIYEMMQGRVE